MRLSPNGQLRILDFDIENRPLSYGGGDFTFGELTAIAASFIGEKKVYTWALGEYDLMTMLSEFTYLFDRADMVTGHFIRGHDLPVLNGALRELGQQPLGKKLTSDTKIDLVPSKHLSNSQESLAAYYGLPIEKVHLTQADWREMNRLTPKGIELTKKRVSFDVRQHKLLRAALIEDDQLGPPKMWPGKGK